MGGRFDVNDIRHRLGHCLSGTSIADMIIASTLKDSIAVLEEVLPINLVSDQVLEQLDLRTALGDGQAFRCYTHCHLSFGSEKEITL